ncbi:MAG: hypothetical protein EZS28_025612 [Streblomastix strix]|uniref:Uncharacterized protein n=1 Tax=Streblomastix strix TaxID=222440 RepID=A0A5J4V8S1_9EUKA|nr:MAG: hypothetical protein EZS28_025612 [Streblomastix strix]
MTIVFGLKEINSDAQSLSIGAGIALMIIGVRFVVHAQEVVAQDVLMDVQIAASIVLKVILVIKKNKRE